MRARPGGCLLPGGRALQRPDLLATQRGGRRRQVAHTTRKHRAAPRTPSAARRYLTADDRPRHPAPNRSSLPAILDSRRPTALPARGPSPTHRNSRRALFVRSRAAPRPPPRKPQESRLCRRERLRPPPRCHRVGTEPNVRDLATAHDPLLGGSRSPCVMACLLGRRGERCRREGQTRCSCGCARRSVS
jgi:hypothetical protein